MHILHGEAAASGTGESQVTAAGSWRSHRLRRRCLDGEVGFSEKWIPRKPSLGRRRPSTVTDISAASTQQPDSGHPG